MTFLAPLALSAIPVAAACDLDTLAGALDAAEKRFATGDAKGVSAALAEARKVMACVREPLPPSTCARVHRARALEAFALADRSVATRSLRAMLHADPFAQLPVTLVPARHPLNLLLVDAEEARPSWTEAPGGWLLVDGVKTGSVPVDQPYIVQPLKGDRPLGARLSD